MFMFCSGCSVVSKSKTDKGFKGNGKEINNLQAIINQNITNQNFYIHKATIEISTPEGKEKFIASVKFKYPDKYLISLKGKTGIEGSRIFISADTILINDRLKRKLYFGSGEYLKNKYGFSSFFLPIILGDYVRNNLSKENTVVCLDNILSRGEIIGGIKINYVIDCRFGKVILVTPERLDKSNTFEIHFSKFLKAGNSLIAGQIEVIDLNTKTKIRIEIGQIEFPWVGEIEFLPGNKYEIINLL
jgi:hypothetical protein